MKTKKIILLIITLAIVCVVGFSGLVGAFADELQRLQDVPFLTVSEDTLDDFAICINSQFLVRQVVDVVSQSSTSIEAITVIMSFFDPSTGQLMTGSPSRYYPIGDLNQLSNGDYFTIPLCLGATNTYQYVAINFVLNDTYFNYFSDIPYITGFTLTNNDGTPHNVSSSLIVPKIGVNGLFIVIPPAGSTSTININVETDYRSYTDEQYQETLDNYEEAYQNWEDAEYRESLLEAEVTDLTTTIAQQTETIDELENRVYNDQIYIAALEEANDGLAQNYNNLKIDYDALEIDYLTTLEDYEYEKTLRETYQELLGEANNQIEALQQMVTEEPVAAGFGWIVYAFEKVGQILEIELLPGITVGLLCLIPLVLGVVFFVLRLIRGE